MTSARTRLHALWAERGWAVGTSVGLPVDSEPGPYRAWVSNGDGPDDCTEAFGPTEEDACAAVLAALEPALPTGTPRELAEVMLSILADRCFHNAWNPAKGSPWWNIAKAGAAQRAAWLAAFDAPALAPEAMALLEALRAAINGSGRPRYWRLSFDERGADDARAAAAWLAAGMPIPAPPADKAEAAHGPRSCADVEALLEAQRRLLATTRAEAPHWVHYAPNTDHLPGDIHAVDARRIFVGGWRFDLPPVPEVKS